MLASCYYLGIYIHSSTHVSCKQDWRHATKHAEMCCFIMHMRMNTYVSIDVITKTHNMRALCNAILYYSLAMQKKNLRLGMCTSTQIYTQIFCRYTHTHTGVHVQEMCLDSCFSLFFPARVCTHALQKRLQIHSRKIHPWRICLCAWKHT
jgi:hypothetical protein